MLGMLEVRLVLRRRDQNPSWMVTARTGTGFSLAKGERERSMTPASRHAA
jgi:hypothetical protein